MSDADRVEDACRSWWDIQRADGTRIATRSWDEVAEAHPEWLVDYRIRMAAALGIKL